MSATLGINKLKIEPVGSTVTVPNNNIAKLMYYLSCVLKVIQYNQNSKLIDFEHYYNLNNEEKKLVYQLALLFKPEIFLEKFLLKMQIYFLLMSVMNSIK